MPFTRPAIEDLIERAAQDIEAALPGVDARLRRSNLSVLGRMHAGAVHGLYGYLDYLAVQLMADTAEVDYLDRHCSIWGVPRKAAAAATGNVTFTGTNGTLVPAGTLLTRADGAEYSTVANVTISAGSAIAVATAALAGASGNADAGTQLTAANPIPGVSSTVLVASGGLSQGVDVESDVDLRGRLLDRIRKPPQGGASWDYQAWALEVPGVTRAWVYPAELGLGTVTVRFVRDDDVSIIPDSGEVAAVQAYIDARRPVTASVTVVAPTAVAVNYTIAVLPNTAAVKAAVEAQLRDLHAREAEPGSTLLLSHIREAISLATGENDYTLTAPSANVTRATGEISTVGTITWV